MILTSLRPRATTTERTTMTTTTTTTRQGRPPLDRVRFDLVVTVELGAVDLEDADDRIDVLLAELRPRLERMVRNTRKGAPAVVTVEALDPSYA